MNSDNLLARMHEIPELMMRGFGVERMADRDIVIERNGHVYATWRIRVDGYHFHPAGYGQATYVVKEPLNSGRLQRRERR